MSLKQAFCRSPGGGKTRAIYFVKIVAKITEKFDKFGLK
jgi:hypothetical protein